MKVVCAFFCLYVYHISWDAPLSVAVPSGGLKKSNESTVTGWAPQHISISIIFSPPASSKHGLSNWITPFVNKIPAVSTSDILSLVKYNARTA